MEQRARIREKNKAYNFMIQKVIPNSFDNNQARVYESIQIAHQQMIIKILQGKVEFADKIQFNSKSARPKLQLDQYEGPLEEKQSLKKVVSQISGQTNFYGEKINFEKSYLKNRIAQISELLRSGVSTYSEKKSLKSQLNELRSREAYVLSRVIRNPLLDLHKTASLKNGSLVKYKSESLIRSPEKMQNLGKRNFSTYQKSDYESKQSQLQKLMMAFPRQSFKMSEREYSKRIKFILDGRPPQLPPLRQSFPDKKSIQQFFPSKIKMNSVRNLSDQGKNQLVFKKLNPQNSQTKRSSKSKQQRVQEGNNMFQAAQKRIRTDFKELQYRTALTQQNLRQTQRKSKGNQYMKQSLLQLKLPIQTYLETHLRKTEERTKLLAHMKKNRAQQMTKQWEDQMDEIIKGDIDKFKGLIKLSVIEKKLQKLGDNYQERIQRKAQILTKSGIV